MSGGAQGRLGLLDASWGSFVGECARGSCVRSAALLLSLLLSALTAQAGLIADGQVLRSIPFSVRDGQKPMLAAKVGEQSGVLMLDNGTPDALFLNREALQLSDGQFVARGSTASGQAIEVHAHRSPQVRIGQLAAPMAATVCSGNFGFTASGLGADFLGFIGTKMLERDAFVLDDAAGVPSVIRVERG